MYFSYINDYSKFLWVQWDQACAKYSTLNKIAHVNCTKTGDMEIAHVNVLEIAIYIHIYIHKSLIKPCSQRTLSKWDYRIQRDLNSLIQEP